MLALDAATFLVSAIALAGLRLPDAPLRVQPSVVRQLVAGWDEFRSRRWIWVTTTQFALFNLLTWGPFLLLGPVAAHESLDGARSWGLIMAAYGAGSVAGGLMALGRRPRRPLIVATAATLGFPLPVAFLAAGASTAEIAVAAVFAGVGAAVFNIFWATTLQHEIPEEALARVQSFVLVGAYSAAQSPTPPQAQSPQPPRWRQSSCSAPPGPFSPRSSFSRREACAP